MTLSLVGSCPEFGFLVLEHYQRTKNQRDEELWVWTRSFHRPTHYPSSCLLLLTLVVRDAEIE